MRMRALTDACTQHGPPPTAAASACQRPSCHFNIDTNILLDEMRLKKRETTKVAITRVPIQV